MPYNTLIVTIGVTCLGLAAGVVGCFLLLRKRSLLGDALSHSTLPGIGLAFVFATLLGMNGKSLAILLTGATVTGTIGVALILFIINTTRIKEDAALGIVLSTFFGLGVAVLTFVQNMKSGQAAGLEAFIYGKTAGMVQQDVFLIAGVAAVVTIISVILMKEFRLLCFDSALAGAQGWPVHLLDAILMALVIAVTVIGLQAVGLILIIALLIVPPAAARFWCDGLNRMIMLSAGIGAASGMFGALFSSSYAGMPAGPIIVLSAGAAFVFSLIFGSHRGLLAVAWEQIRIRHNVGRQNVLRAMYERNEAKLGLVDEPITSTVAVTFAELLACRSWQAATLHRNLQRAIKEGMLKKTPPPDAKTQAGGTPPAAYELTRQGLTAAWRVTRNHRLWELYLTAHADVAPSFVDRSADQVEHILDTPMIKRLETLLADEFPDLLQPPTVHVPTIGGGEAVA